MTTILWNALKPKCEKQKTREGISAIQGTRQRMNLRDTSDSTRLIIRELSDAVEVQFGDVMAITAER